MITLISAFILSPPTLASDSKATLLSLLGYVAS